MPRSSREKVGDDTVLLAYVAADPALHAALTSALRDRLRIELPTAMRPSRLVLLNRLPFLPGGEVNLHTLPDPAVGHAKRWRALLGRLRRT